MVKKAPCHGLQFLNELQATTLPPRLGVTANAIAAQFLRDGYMLHAEQCGIDNEDESVELAFSTRTGVLVWITVELPRNAK